MLTLLLPIEVSQFGIAEAFAFHQGFHLLQTGSDAFKDLSSGQPPDSAVQQEIRMYHLQTMNETLGGLTRLRLFCSVS